MEDQLIITGARQHNLKNVSLTIPKNRFIVFTGVSGSGKSSLAFDTIYAEGQRRYVESLSSYARQFLGIMDKPDVDRIAGLSPAISIDQKSSSHNPRSTVGTVTEIYDYLRLLYARVGHPHCPKCQREIAKLSVDQIVDYILESGKRHLSDRTHRSWKVCILSPVVRDRKGEFTGLLKNLQSKGYRKVRIDGVMMDIDDHFVLMKTNSHTVDVVIDMIVQTIQTFRDKKEYENLRRRIFDAAEQAAALSGGIVVAGTILDTGFSLPDKPTSIQDTVYSEQYSCPSCGISIPELEPRTFSFNSPHGACPECTGLGIVSTIDPQKIIQPELSLSEGGVLPFSTLFLHDTWFSRVIQEVCSRNNIDPKKQMGMLSDADMKLLLFGTGESTYTVHGRNRFGEKTVIHETFRGFIPELMRRYHEAQSDYVKGHIEQYMKQEPCLGCSGTRLRKESLTVTIDGSNIHDMTALTIREAIPWFERVMRSDPSILSDNERIIGNPIIREILGRLRFLQNVGLEYLTLERPSLSLSGGEAQRIRLASQIGSGLSGVLYILDEPSIGLHPRDNNKLITTLSDLRNLGNTVVVVEHDREIMTACDHIVDFGPGAGDHGGTVVAQGNWKQIAGNHSSVTGSYLSGKKIIVRSSNRPPTTVHAETPRLTIDGCTKHNLKHISVSFPLGSFICITGVSGSGKSSLVVDTLYPALVSRCSVPITASGAGYRRIKGLEHIDKAILIDQSPIGRTPRSNPATYTGLFTHVRDIFSQLSESRLRGYTSGRFSFNIKGGRCEACEGEGHKKIEMQFLSDVYITCDSCKGTRYNSETLEVEYKGKTIAQILAETVDEAIMTFSNHTGILEKLRTLHDVGLGYMHLGQSAPTLSGGEAQRVKLSSELSRRGTGKTVYILDEPTTGLHFQDIDKLLRVFEQLTAKGNTVIVVEHNLDIIKNADWIIDLGPEGGNDGGFVVAEGTPHDIKNTKQSLTGLYL